MMETLDEYARIDFDLVDFLRARYFWPHDNTREEDTWYQEPFMLKWNFLLDYYAAIDRWREVDALVPTPYTPPSDDDAVLDD